MHSAQLGQGRRDAQFLCHRQPDLVQHSDGCEPDPDRHGVPWPGRGAGLRRERSGAVLRVRGLSGRARRVPAPRSRVSAAHDGRGWHGAAVPGLSSQRAQTDEHPLQRARRPDGDARLPGQHRGRAEPGPAAAERQQRDRRPPERPVRVRAAGLGGEVGLLPAGHQPSHAEPRRHLAPHHLSDGSGHRGNGLHRTDRHTVSAARSGCELFQLPAGASQRQSFHALPLHG